MPTVFHLENRFHIRRLNRALRHKSRLLLSACGSAQSDQDEQDWLRAYHGAVGDAQATRFAEQVYQGLAQRQTLEVAVAQARHALLTETEQPAQD